MRQQVLSAIDFRRLRQYRRAAVRHQQINRCAQSRVGADAGIAVRTTTLQANGDVCRAARLALHIIGAGQHGVDEGYAFFYGFGGAAGVLDVEHLEVVAFRQVAAAQPGFDLVALTAQAHHQRAPEVDVGGIASQGALQNLHTQARIIHAAAGAVRQRDHAIDVGESRQSTRIGAAGKVV
jgi:hypothetical protein